ncbi:MAG: hypothetical protein NC453_27065, partial [Muribaculum sp.]|nr:hypothetical protein [Muribaculum sp.]
MRNHTVELFHNDTPTWPECRPEHGGSGVAIEYCGRYFVITASHVIVDYAGKRLRNPDRSEEDYDEPDDAYLTLNNIGFYHNGYFFTCKRVFYTTAPVNNIDVAILLIDDVHAKDWSDSVKFIT